jgi:hypothetical protein
MTCPSSFFSINNPFWIQLLVSFALYDCHIRLGESNSHIKEKFIADIAGFQPVL